MIVALLVACSAEPPPLIEAHRGGAGYWPENSRTAMLGAIELGFDGIELDLVLTRDEVPVLAHDPWLAGHCRTVDGAELPEPVPIRDVSLARLQRDYVCGGVPDPSFPSALVVAEPPMSLDELLVALRHHGDPSQLVHLDIKQEPGLTASPRRFATAILDRWVAADLPNPMWVSSPRPEVIQAFERRGRELAIEVPTILSIPEFPRGEGELSVALRNERRLLMGALDYVDAAREAHADGVSLQWELADRQLAAAAQREGLIVMLWTLNDPDALRHHARWPVDVLITDFPGDL